jgi:hypothetical protein
MTQPRSAIRPYPEWASVFASNREHADVGDHALACPSLFQALWHAQCVATGDSRIASKLATAHRARWQNAERNGTSKEGTGPSIPSKWIGSRRHEKRPDAAPSPTQQPAGEVASDASVEPRWAGQDSAPGAGMHTGMRTCHASPAARDTSALRWRHGGHRWRLPTLLIGQLGECAAASPLACGGGGGDPPRCTPQATPLKAGPLLWKIEKRK